MYELLRFLSQSILLSQAVMMCILLLQESPITHPCLSFPYLGMVHVEEVQFLQPGWLVHGVACTYMPSPGGKVSFMGLPRRESSRSKI